MDVTPLRFVGESIEAQFDEPPELEKKPDCPDRFVWAGKTFDVVELITAWDDYDRKGRMAKNMQPEHAAVAASRGSWGVGRHYFRVRTDADRIFELYYDRSPRKNRKGEWILYRELASV